MLQAHQIQQKTTLKDRKQQSLRLNRLVKFLQDKKSPSFKKLKHILLRNDNMMSDRPVKDVSLERDLNSLQNTQRQSVVVNTKNIFVANNKTKPASHRAFENTDKGFYKVFITKQAIKILYQKEASGFLPFELKQKLYPKDNSQQINESHLFPSLAIPKTKRALTFQKYQDESTRWLNTQIQSLRNIPLNTEQHNLTEQKQQKQINKANIRNLPIEKQKYAKSLQKIIDKALRTKTKDKSLGQNFTNIIQGIQSQRYDERLFVKGEPIEQGQNNQKSAYAQKGKLLTNPNLKLKRKARFKSQRKQIFEKNSEINSKYEKETQNLEVNEKKRILHTNRQAYYLQSSLKLKTEIATNTAEYHQKSICNQNKTLRVIKKLEASIIRSNQQIKQKTQNTSQKKIEILLDPHSSSALKNIISQSQKNKRQSRRQKDYVNNKFKTMQAEVLPQLSKKTLTKWEIVGYDWLQSPEDLHRNLELQSYVQKMTKKPKSESQTKK